MLDRRQVRLGIAPIGWTNDDRPGLGEEFTYQQVMSEAALAGFEGCGIGHRFPTDAPTLNRQTELRRLGVTSRWATLQFTRNAMRERSLAEARGHVAFLEEVGARDLVCAELGHSVHQLPVAVFPNKPVFSDEQWRALVDGLHEVGRVCRDKGMTLCYHPHTGTGVQTYEEIARLVESTDPGLVSLLYDTGHLYFSGVDPMRVVRDFGARIGHVHLKDVRQGIMDRVIRDNESFLDAVVAGVFTVPGDGVIDFRPILEALAEQGFEGWLEVEAEQDPAKADPLEYARKTRAYLREILGF